MFPQVSIQKLRETLILTVFSLSAARGIGVSKNYHFRAGLFTINMGHLTACSSLAAMSCKGIALVTGAGKSAFPALRFAYFTLAQGIGRGVALRLAEDGFDVAVNDVSGNSDKLDTLVDEVRKKGRASSKHIADVSQDELVKAMVEQVVKQHGGLDVVRVFNFNCETLIPVDGCECRDCRAWLCAHC